ncbi:MAG TPA: sigma-54 dependent transcriptional regulator [Cyclobacteriaceae bacterium]|nr:sigma-54 dependent transcriptional regulator [Cyclobacteriaceae bacterium]
MNYITKIFLIDDDEMYSTIIKSSIEQNDNYDVKVFKSGEDFMENIHHNPDIVIIDYTLPGMSGIEILRKIKEYNSDISTIILSGQDKVEVVVEAYNIGANNYIIKSDRVIVEINHAIKNLSSNSNLRKEVVELREKIIDRNKYSQIIGESSSILNVIKLIQKVESSKLITIITGESGTGKEVVANAIHYNSPRKRKAFVPVNMAAIPVDLIESELFGHEKGAFTGADGRRIGKFEEANEGTIFLDEIGEMPMDLQAKLLRVLQDNKISRVGSNKQIELDIRVVAATNKNLKERVKQGKFREDLMYRLQGFLIHLSPLRERGNDIIILSKFFLEDFSKANKMKPKSLAPGAVERLLKYDWPGNVRELKAVIERSILLSDTDKIQAEDLIFIME